MASDPRDTPTLPDEGEFAPAFSRGAAIGRFLVLDVLGVGGMGVVLSAYDPHLDRKVALKILRGERWSAAAPGGRRDALVREAQLTARLSHPNVVAVHEVAFVDETAYVVMEQVEGKSLRAWLAARPGWREVLAVMREAGAGLAAAHRAGIIHRDIKPDNVLLGNDGRPRVSDFGLAALEVEPGLTAGTLGYMAPEQAAGETIDARADQYAFCVTLWEALHGVRPQAAPPLARDGQAPAWLDRACARGLAARPEDRWPSMDALLAALRPPVSRWRTRGVAAAALAVIGAVAFDYGRRNVTAAAPCQGSAALVASLWDQPARDRVEAAFRATGRAYAGDTFQRVDAALRARLDGWAKAHGNACADTHVRHIQSDSLLDLRMRCLARARSEIRSLIDELAAADVTALGRSTVAAGAVGDVEACSDAAGLDAVVPPPRDPATAREVDALRDEIARLGALMALGHWKAGNEAVPALVERARAVGYTPILARALVEAGTIRIQAGNVASGIDNLYESTRVGAAAHEDAVVLRALNELMFALGSRLQQFEAAEVTYRAAQAAWARAGQLPSGLRQLYVYRGHVLTKKRDDRGALWQRLMALGLTMVDKGDRSPEAGMALAYLAGTVTRLGRAPDAWPIYERALGILEKAVGPEHPWYTGQLGNAAGSLMDAYEHDAAAPLLERILAIEERVYGAENRALGEPIAKLARVRYEQRRLTEARELAQRSMAIASAELGAEHPEVADGLMLLGAIEQLQGKPAAAHELYQKALAMRRAAFGTDNSKVSETYGMDAGALLELGDRRGARAAADQAIAIDRKTIGEEHPDFAESLVALADVLAAERRFAEAVPLYRRAVALLETEQRIGSPALAEPLTRLCDALVDAGDAPGALAAARRAVTSAARAPVDVAAAANFCLARAGALAGHDASRARAQAREARAKVAALPYSVRVVARIDRWLATH